MSNYVSSTITVNRETYNRIQREANSAASLRSDIASLNRVIATLNANLDAADKRNNDALREINNVKEALNTANAAAKARDTQLQAEIQAAYNDTINRMQRQAKETQDSINTLRQDFGDAIKDSIEANNRVIEQAINSSNEQLTGMINDLRDETNTAIAGVEAGLQNLTQGAASLLDSAHDYMDQISALQNEIAGTRHEILLPGKYDNVQALANLANANVSLAEKNPMNAAVARDKAREAFTGLLRFLEEVALAEQEWQAQLAAAEQISSVLAEQIQNSRTIEPRSGHEIDVDYWSNNGISVNESDYQNLAAALKNPEKLRTDQLVDLQQAMVEISRRVDETVADAYVRVSSSQQLTRVGERIHRALNESGNLVVIDHSFEGNDQRGSYRFISRNDKTGLTVVVTVSVREENGELLITPEADIVDYGNMNSAEAELFVRGVMEGISGKENTSCTETPGNSIKHPERRDFDSWKQPREIHHEPLVRSNNDDARKTKNN